jgi:hypothetical protein
MAKLNKQLLTDNLMVLNPELKDEELATKTAAELNQMITDLRASHEPAAPRVPAKLNDPGAKVNDQNTIVEGEEKTEVKDESKKTMETMEDMKNAFIGILNI